MVNSALITFPPFVAFLAPPTLAHFVSKPVSVNVLCVFVLITYIATGTLVLLHFEKHFDAASREDYILETSRCVNQVLSRPSLRVRNVVSRNLARSIVRGCMLQNTDPRQRWTFINAALYAFGIVTTLGYGKIEPATINGRVFSVIYGFFGIPITMIIFTNFGKFIELFIIKAYCKLFSRNDNVNEKRHAPLSTSALILIILSYLLLGATLMPLLNSHIDFYNGLYWSFLCFTAIEFGELIPINVYLLPLAVIYICLGLAISTIALDVGSGYVRRLHFIGRKLRDMAHVRIWFGGKTLKVRELVVALGQYLGVESNLMRDIDVDNLVSGAIKVKEGKLSRVPQSYTVVEGIWPPELVPLFLKDGAFPDFVDDDKLHRSLSQRHSQSSVHFAPDLTTEITYTGSQTELRTIQENEETKVDEISRIS